ncbi:MAG TPA: glycosyltransferase family A protein [Tepidisphaeraceae bacterium]|nr:glycosyltransferase family A protein [Tepidisphaeraceae bacterium]
MGASLLDAGVLVVIPAHNVARYLPQGIRSIVNQTIADWHCVIVDDGSTDATADVAQRLAEDDRAGRITVVRQPNRGLSAARNAGERAGPPTQFVLFLDADDELFPDALDSLRQCLQRNLGHVAAHGYARLIDPDGESLPDGDFQQVLRYRNTLDAKGRLSRNSPTDPTTFCALAVNNCIISTGTAMIRRAAFRASYGFDTTLRSAEDWDIWLRISRDSDLLFVDRPIMKYRRSPNSMSSNHWRMAWGIQWARAKLLHDSSNSPAQAAYARRAYRTFYRTLGSKRLGELIHGSAWNFRGLTLAMINMALALFGPSLLWCMVLISGRSGSIATSGRPEGST